MGKLRILYENNLSVYAMTNEDPSYPKENLLNRHPGKVTKSSSTSSKILFKLSSGSSISLINANLTGSTLTVIQPDSYNSYSGSNYTFQNTNEISNPSATFTSFLNAGDEFTITGSASNDGFYTVDTVTDTLITVLETVVSESAGAAIEIVSSEGADKEVFTNTYWRCGTWFNYATGRRFLTSENSNSFNYYVNATVILEIEGDDPSVGVVYGGYELIVGVPQYGETENMNDFSIYQETANGSINSVERAVRVDSTVPVLCSVSESDELTRVLKNNPTNFKVFIIVKDDDKSLIKYGVCKTKPSFSWGKPDQKSYTLNISEVI